MNEQTTPLSQDIDYIKLTKNSKGYTWDIKSVSHDIDKIKEINDKLLALYGELVLGSLN